MHVVLNAISIRPGGGLTVFQGLVRSLRLARPTWRIGVLTGNDATHRGIAAMGDADKVERVVSGRSLVGTYGWQHIRLGRHLRAAGADVLISPNFHCPHVPCRQIVFHLNIRRFCRLFRSRNPRHVALEWLRDRAARRALSLANANVFESRCIRDAARQMHGGTIRGPSVVYIGLPDELLNLERRDRPHAAASRRLLAVTSPHPHKDNPTLIAALAELLRLAPAEDWRLDIAGGVEHQAWMPTRRLAERLGVAARITWHGFCDADRLSALSRDSLCLISTSQLESFAMVALEAMARGCPPIVADCASMPESVADAGLLARPGDPGAFAAAVIRLLTEPQLRSEMVRRGYHRINNFRWATCGHAFAEIIEQTGGRSQLPRTASAA